MVDPVIGRYLKDSMHRAIDGDWCVSHRVELAKLSTKDSGEAGIADGIIGTAFFSLYVVGPFMTAGGRGSAE